MITSRAWGEYTLYTLENGVLSVQIADLGATIVSLKYLDKERVIGHASPEGYLEQGGCPGATIGRYANRIGGAAFTLNGTEYKLVANEGRNQLHGGNQSYHHHRQWVGEIDGETLQFTLFSPDGDNGFPGCVTATVSYRLDGSTLRVDYEAESDSDTHYAPTNHSYFDLSGEGNCLRARFQVNAESYLEVDEEKIPVAVRSVEGTRFDFRTERPVGEDYDHCLILSGSPACTLRDGGTTLEIFTDFPALQVYTGSGLKGDFKPNQALALEPEFYPDSPNHPEYPSTLLRLGDHFHKYIEYKFT